MNAIKHYLIDHFEGRGALISLLVVACIVWFVDVRLFFLKSFYLPVLLSSYYLMIRSGVPGAFLTFLMVVIFSSLYP